MSRKILLAGILGGVALFAWESVAHMALPLGEAGIRTFGDREGLMMTALKDNVRESGFYFFPGPEDRPGMTNEQKAKSMDAAMQRMASQPTGIMIVHPQGWPPNLAKRLPLQFAGDVVVMLIAAGLLAQAVMLKEYGARVLFVTLMGLIPTLQTDMPQWNWYGFPDLYFGAQFLVHLVGFAAGGLVLARLVK
jgi:hypothetical protein